MVKKKISKIIYMFGIESYKNKDELLEEQYKAKYLKYKQKYLELSQTGGNIIPGIYAYLTTEDKANELVALYNICTPGEGLQPFNVDEVNQLTDPPSIKVTNNINKTDNIKNTEFQTFVETEQIKFNQNVERKKEEFLKSFKTDRAKFEKLLNDKLVSCNTPKSADIDSLLNDNAYKIRNNSKKIELILKDSAAVKTVLRVVKGTEKSSKKNSSTIPDLKNAFNKDTPDFSIILSNIAAGNKMSEKPNPTVPTHYVLIEELKLMSPKLVGDGKPKPIPQ